VSSLAIIRVEQLYPLPQTQLDAIVAKYKKAKAWIWIQEEPENMGAWSYMLRHYRTVSLDVIARPESASPATGSSKIHQIEQLELYEQALEKSFYKEKELRGYLKHFSQEQ